MGRMRDWLPDEFVSWGIVRIGFTFGDRKMGLRVS